MFALVILGLIFGMFAIGTAGMLAFLEVALRPAPPDDNPELVSYASGREARSRRHAEIPKSHVA